MSNKLSRSMTVGSLRSCLSSLPADNIILVDGYVIRGAIHNERLKLVELTRYTPVPSAELPNIKDLRTDEEKGT